MNKIYRKVLSDERLPKGNEVYITEKGLMTFNDLFGWINCHNYTSKSPLWWLEEICLPDGIEFEGKRKIENCKDLSYNDGYVDGWDSCYEYIINKIQGGK